MGTFIIRPTSLVSGGTPIEDSIVGADPFAGWMTENYPVFGLLDSMLSEVATDCDVICVALFPQTYTTVARFGFSGNSIYLDGSLIPTDLSSLPVGFNPLTASLKVHINVFQQPNVGHTRYYLQHDNGFDGPQDTDDYSYNFTPPTAPSMSDIINNGCGIHPDIVVGDSSGLAGVLSEIYNLRIEGTYEIETFQFTLDNPTTPVSIGTKLRPPSGSTISNEVVITSPPDPLPPLPPLDPPGLDFSELDSVTPVRLQFPAANGDIISFDLPLLSIITLTATLLDFLIPIILIPYIITYYPRGLPPTLPITIIVIGNGTQFSGSITLGTLTLLLVEGSGLYRIVKGKTTDSVYNRFSGYTTINKLIFLPLFNDEIVEEEGLFDLLPYPYRILASLDSDETDDSDIGLSIIGRQQLVVTTYETTIPNPFIETGFIGT